MAEFSFTIVNPKYKDPDPKSEDQNPNKKSVLFIGEPNQLNFIFSNAGGPPRVNPGDVFTIMIPDILIKTGNADQLLSKDWKVNESGVTHEDGYYNYYLTPQNPLDFNSELTISLHNLNSQNATHGEVKCNVFIGHSLGNYNCKLFVNHKPDQPDSLYSAIRFTKPVINGKQQEVNQGSVYVSPTGVDEATNQLTPPIDNKIEVLLKYIGSTQLVDKPYTNPTFTFTFSYGSNSNDLTNAIKSHPSGGDFNPLTSAWNIQASIGDSDSDRWQINSLEGDTPSWEVIPTESNLDLFTLDKPNLKVVFDHVITALAPGDATVYIQWNNIPGFNDGYEAYNLPKVTAYANLLGFTPSKSGIYSRNELVELSWRSFAAEKLQLTWIDDDDPNNTGELEFTTFSSESQPYLVYYGDNHAAVGSYSPPFKSSFASYNCQLMVAGHPNTMQSLTLNLDAAEPPVISNFSVEVVEQAEGNTLTLSWSVETDNVNAYCIIDGIDLIFDLNESHQIYYTRDQGFPREFTLRVKGFYPEVSCVLKQSFKIVQTIPGFNIMDRQPNTNRLFLNKGMNDYRIFYCDALNIPEHITDNIAFGDMSQGWLSLFLSPDGKNAFVTNAFNPMPNNKVYYFDPTNPTSTASDSITAMNDPIAVFFLPDSSRAFITSRVNSKVAYFDTANPPANIEPQIQIPTSAGQSWMRSLTFSNDGKIAFWCADGNYHKAFHFDAINPPATMSEENQISSEFNFSSIQTSPDNKFVFTLQGDGKLVSYFPINNIPAQIEDSIQVDGYTEQILFTPKSKWAFLSVETENPLVYFDWSDPPEEPTGIVKLPGGEILVKSMLINPAQDTIVFLFGNQLSFTSATDPSEIPEMIYIENNPQEIYFSLNGSKVFVNVNSDTAVKVLEVCYVKE